MSFLEMSVQSTLVCASVHFSCSSPRQNPANRIHTIFRIMEHAQTHQQLMASHQPYTIQRWLTSLAPQGVDISNPTLDECVISFMFQHQGSRMWDLWYTWSFNMWQEETQTNFPVRYQVWDHNFTELGLDTQRECGVPCRQVLTNSYDLYL